MKNKFIVIEGLEGAGKTTATKIVVNTLQEHGIKDYISIRDPGGTLLGEQIRTFIKKGIDGEKLTNKAELLMLYTARIQLLENVIKPALSRGAWVVSDRYDLSTQAYQGGGRGLDKTLINTLRDILLKDFHPALTLYLDVTPTIGLQRVHIRCDKLDRIEQETLCFFERTRHHYLSLVTTDPSIKIIDATQSLSTMILSVKQVLCNWLMGQYL